MRGELYAARRVGLLATPAVLALTVFALTQFFWSRTLGVVPQAVNWLDDLVALGIGCLALTRAPPPVRVSRTWVFALAVFLLVALAGAIGNAVPPMRAILGLRAVLIYLPLYYGIAVSDLGRQNVRTILVWLLVFALVQLPAQLAELAVAAARVGLDFTILNDTAVGTFGSGMANAMGLFMIPFISFGVGMWFVSRRRRWLALTTVFGGSLVLSSGRAAMVLLPVCLIWMAALSLGWRRLASPKYVLMLILVAATIATTADVYYRTTTGAGVAQHFSPRRLIQEQLTYSPKSSSRLAYYPLTLEILATEAVSPWLGLGPGNYASSAGFLTNAPGLNLIRDVFGQWQTGRETALNSQFLTSLGEFGILGVVAFYALIGFLLRRTLRVRRAETDPSMRTALAAIAVGQLVFCLGTLVEPVWEDQVLSFPFWLTAALVTKLAQERDVSERRGPPSSTSDPLAPLSGDD